MSVVDETPVWNMGKPCEPGALCVLCAAPATEIDWNGLPICSTDEHYDPISGDRYQEDSCESCDQYSTKLLRTTVGAESMGYDRLLLCLPCRTPEPQRERGTQ